MKSLVAFLILLGSLSPSLARPARAQEVVEPGAYGPLEQDPHRNRWFLGTDQGVLFFVRDGGNFINAQYYSTIYGGYNIREIVQPMVRIGQAIGSANAFFNPTTFFFIFEAAVKVTPVRYWVRPYFLGSAGMYVLSFDDFGFPVRDNVNFTYSGGGGLEFSFGRNTVGLGSAFRGFNNSGLNLYGVEVTFGYTFSF